MDGEPFQDKLPPLAETDKSLVQVYIYWYVCYCTPVTCSSVHNYILFLCSVQELMKQKEELTKQRDSKLEEIVTVCGDQSHQNVYGGYLYI